MQSAADNPYPRQRNPRACEACRTSKSRCFASDEPNICQRCLKACLSCSVRTMARPRRQKRVALPSAEVNVLKPDFVLDEENSEAVYIKLKRLPPFDSRDNVSKIHLHHQEVFKKLLPTADHSTGILAPAATVRAVPTPLSNQSDEAAIEQGPSHRIITFEQAEELLRKFHGIKHFFPFVVVPEDASIKSLSRHSPFLLLAMLCAASTNDIQLVNQLDHEFKRVLSEKIICEGRKNLDFLQGLLVYIAWYPCHLRPKNRQAFMYVNLAISLLDDLGIGCQDNRTTLCPDNVEYEGLLEDGGFSRAAKRAHLGCYYLSSNISMGFQKPNGLTYTGIMDEYGKALARDAEFWSDLTLLPSVKCHNIREKIKDSLFALEKSAGSFDASPFQAEMNLQVFHNETEEWKRSMPQEIKSLPSILLAERFLTINVFSHDLAFFRPIPAQHPHHLNPVTLSRCLEACKKFFESLLSIPSAQYHAFTNVEWSNIIQSIIILSRLSFPLPRCPGWDVVAAREHAPLGMFLDCLCYRMQALSSVPATETNPKAPDAPFIFRLVLESIKKSYEARIALITPPITTVVDQSGNPIAALQTPAASPIDKLHCPMNDRELLSYFESLMHDSNEGFGNGPTTAWTAPKNIPVYHDLWATMTMNWSDY